MGSQQNYREGAEASLSLGTPAVSQTCGLFSSSQEAETVLWMSVGGHGTWYSLLSPVHSGPHSSASLQLARAFRPSSVQPLALASVTYPGLNIYLLERGPLLLFWMVSADGGAPWGQSLGESGPQAKDVGSSSPQPTMDEQPD